MLVSIDRARLVELAVAADCVVHVVPAIGAFVPSGSRLLRIEGDIDRFDRDAAIAALGSALERTLDEDVAYGFRMLVDMAERALSDSPFLDPTTAVQATRSSARRATSTGASANSPTVASTTAVASCG